MNIQPTSVNGKLLESLDLCGSFSQQPQQMQLKPVFRDDTYLKPVLSLTPPRVT